MKRARKTTSLIPEKSYQLYSLQKVTGMQGKNFDQENEMEIASLSSYDQNVNIISILQSWVIRKLCIYWCALFKQYSRKNKKNVFPITNVESFQVIDKEKTFYCQTYINNVMLKVLIVPACAYVCNAQEVLLNYYSTQSIDT